MTRQELEKWVDKLPVQKVKALLVECVDELMLTESIDALEDNEPYWDASGDRLSDIRVDDDTTHLTVDAYKNMSIDESVTIFRQALNGMVSFNNKEDEIDFILDTTSKYKELAKKHKQ